jgi:hypothetical protein
VSVVRGPLETISFRYRQLPYPLSHVLGYSQSADRLSCLARSGKVRGGVPLESGKPHHTPSCTTAGEPTTCPRWGSASEFPKRLLCVITKPEGHACITQFAPRSGLGYFDHGPASFQPRTPKDTVLGDYWSDLGCVGDTERLAVPLHVPFVLAERTLSEPPSIWVMLTVEDICALRSALCLAA